MSDFAIQVELAGHTAQTGTLISDVIRLAAPAIGVLTAALTDTPPVAEWLGLPGRPARIGRVYRFIS